MILVVRVADSRGARAVGQLMTDPGDIVEIVPDTHTFTPAELGNPDYRFVRVPLVQVEADALLAPDVDPVKKIARRVRAQALPLGLLNRAKAGEVFDLGRAVFLAAIARKAAS